MRGLLILLLMGLWACGSKGSAADSPCRLEAAHEVVRAEALRFDGIAATAASQAGALVSWSESAGLFVRKVNSQGKPTANGVRVAERCAGGLALLDTTNGKHWLACSRPAADPQVAQLVLIRLDANGKLEGERTIGHVGRDGQGVSLARTPTRLLIAYHDGTVGAYAARLSILPVHEDRSWLDVPISEILLSNLAFAAGAPSISARGEHWLASFSETRIVAEGARTRIVLRSDTQSARNLRESLIHEPTPSVGWDETSAWVAYRDRSLKNSKPELFVTRLSGRLTPEAKTTQVGRANSEGAPLLFACGRQLIGLLPRDYASERYIGLHALDLTLNNLGAGHQYYANSRDFVLADGVCLNDQALVIASERKSPAEPGASLMAMPFRCAQAR